MRRLSRKVNVSMPLVSVNGTKIKYAIHGAGEPVLMVMGTGSPGHVWHLHQAPALVRAGYQVITFDNRGIERGYGDVPRPTLANLVGDVVGLVEELCGSPTRLVGTSMGAQVVQEVMLCRPDLVRQGVLMATRGRRDSFRTALARAEEALVSRANALPPQVVSVWRAIQSLSPYTLNDNREISNWLELLELFPTPIEVLQAQLGLECGEDRLDAYQDIRTRCLVISFADDLVTPPHLSQEVADAIPGAKFVSVDRAGHFGYLERPDVTNRLLVDFFAEAEQPVNVKVHQLVRS